MKREVRGREKHANAFVLGKQRNRGESKEKKKKNLLSS